ncbi:helix-turn-helix domain-containing protein [Gordonia oryzae]|uniref:helix-turn-helix domain-containing protein n=1 Tax=Gordonia oryzae TaxID=2487349 RepID=UPI003F8272CB
MTEADAPQSGRVFDEAGAAVHLSVPARTLKSWRYAGTGPAFHRMGRLIRYTEREIDEFIGATRVEPSPQPPWPRAR